MGHELRDTLLRSVQLLKRANEIDSHKYRSDDDDLSEVIWIRGAAPESVRTRGDRTLEEIPLGELHQIAKAVAAQYKLEVGSQSHFRAILESLELKRLTSNAESILMSAVTHDFIPTKGK